MCKEPKAALSQRPRFDSIEPMFVEATTLASATRLLETSLREEYELDPGPIFERAGVPLGIPESAEARYPLSKVKSLWACAREATGDTAIGLKTGKYAQASQFHAFGYSWSASNTLLDGMQRLTRYIRLISTASAELRLTEEKDAYSLSAIFPDESEAPPREGIESGMTALLALCDAVSGKTIRPLRVVLTCGRPDDPQVYRDALRAPVTFNADVGAMVFSKETLLERLPHATPEVARATDRVAEEYIDTLDAKKIASQVRRLLIDMLPSGEVDRDTVCERLGRSRSSLQRQLNEEGLSYRDVLDSTRQSLAENYLKDKKHSHAEIAFMLGFSDQSNFSRAFKRWTSQSPGEFQQCK